MKLDERNAILASLRAHGCPSLEELFRDCTWVDDDDLAELRGLLSNMEGLLVALIDAIKCQKWDIPDSALELLPREECWGCGGKCEVEAYKGEPSQGTEMIRCPDCNGRGWTVHADE